MNFSSLHFAPVFSLFRLHLLKFQKNVQPIQRGLSSIVYSDMVSIAFFPLFVLAVAIPCTHDPLKSCQLIGRVVFLSPSCSFLFLAYPPFLFYRTILLVCKSEKKPRWATVKPKNFALWKCQEYFCSSKGPLFQPELFCIQNRPRLPLCLLSMLLNPWVTPIQLFIFDWY